VRLGEAGRGPHNRDRMKGGAVEKGRETKKGREIDK
jgi:hypothetical protein